MGLSQNKVRYVFMVMKNNVTGCNNGANSCVFNSFNQFCTKFSRNFGLFLLIELLQLNHILGMSGGKDPLRSFQSTSIGFKV